MSRSVRIFVFLFTCHSLWAELPATDHRKVSANKIGIDIRLGLNQASVGGILHLTKTLAVNPYILYRNQEQTNNFVSEPGSGNSSTYNSYKESYFGFGGFIPIYVARIEDLHIRLLPGASYAAGKLQRSQSTNSGAVYDQSANATIVNVHLFLGLQYALNKHLHLMGELGFGYREYRTPFFTDRTSNLYSGNIGIIFYLN